jgi:hypothetical protein
MVKKSFNPYCIISASILAGMIYFSFKAPGNVSGRTKVKKWDQYTDDELEKIASDFAYATSGDYDKAVWRLQDPDYTKKLLPGYLKAIKEFEKKHNIKL